MVYILIINIQLKSLYFGVLMKGEDNEKNIKNFNYEFFSSIFTSS